MVSRWAMQDHSEYTERRNATLLHNISVHPAHSAQSCFMYSFSRLSPLLTRSGLNSLVHCRLPWGTQTLPHLTRGWRKEGRNHKMVMRNVSASLQTTPKHPHLQAPTPCSPLPRCIRVGHGGFCVTHRMWQKRWCVVSWVI